MATNDDAFTAVAKSLNYTFRAKSGATWIPTWGFFTDERGFDPRFDIGAQLGGWYYGVKAYGGHGLDLGEPEAKRGPAVNAYSDFAGVLGTGVYVPGVAGTSIRGSGVYGQTDEEDREFPIPRSPNYNLTAGVAGASSSRVGVRGWSGFIGIWGEGVYSLGVRGDSREGIGVDAFAVASGAPAMRGWSEKGPGVLGYSGAPGPSYGVLGVNALNPGVMGTSDQHVGVLGTSNALPGLWGYSTNQNGIIGHTGNPNAYAGYFLGNVLVTGTIYMMGGKSAAVPFPDGTRRALYAWRARSSGSRTSARRSSGMVAPWSSSTQISRSSSSAATIACSSRLKVIAAGSTFAASEPRISRCASLRAVSRMSRSPTASSAGARTSDIKHASPRSIRVYRCLPRRRAHRARAPRHRRRGCAQSSPASIRKCAS
jgi:hypothetical protein